MATKNFKLNPLMCKAVQIPVETPEGKIIGYEVVTGIQVFGHRSRPITNETLTDDIAEYLMKKPNFELAVQKINKKETKTKE